MKATQDPESLRQKRTRFVEALAALAAKRQKSRPVETAEILAQRTRNVERLAAALKRERRAA